MVPDQVLALGVVAKRQRLTPQAYNRNPLISCGPDHLEAETPEVAGTDPFGLRYQLPIRAGDLTLQVLHGVPLCVAPCLRPR
jgi:hypothetical protein